jgi:hypothetical protein
VTAGFILRGRHSKEGVVVKIVTDMAQFGQIGTLIVGSVGVCVALVNQRRQLNAQMYIEFSARFQSLLRLFPTDAWLANRSPSKPLPPCSQELTDCTLYCVQVVHDAFHLHKGGYISKRLWRLWEREIRQTLSGRIFRREWEVVAAEFAHNPAFLRYIAELMHRDTAECVKRP